MTGYSEVTLPLTPWVLHNFRMSDLPGVSPKVRCH
jgi:hypothetical protein